MSLHNAKMKIYSRNFSIKLAAMAFFTLCLSACSSHNNHNAPTLALAPPPPPSALSGYHFNNAPSARDELASATSSSSGTYQVAQLEGIEPASGFAGNVREDLMPVQDKLAMDDKKKSGDRCSIKDRFDRGAVFAYEFGEKDRSRVAFDVGGLNLSNTGIKDARISFTYRLQADKPRKQRCRYASAYQGLIGSGYNELVERQGNDTVWHEAETVRRDLVSRLGL